MSEGEVLVFFICGGLALTGLATGSPARLHRLYFRNAAPNGTVRLAVWLSLGWTAWVLWNRADPSVVGVYRAFYLVMCLAVVRCLTPLAGRLFGVRFRVDVLERSNPASALLLGALILATGLIFGGCLWGEADPDGDDEGGWWIPVGFFLAGWGTLLAALALFLWREPGPIRRRIRQDRQVPAARAAALYTLASALPITRAVAGDFYGWREGLLGVAAIALLLGIREAFTLAQDRIGDLLNRDGPSRNLESGAYLVTGLLYLLLHRSLDGWLAALQ